MSSGNPSLFEARYRVVFTPAGWQVIDTFEARDPVAEFCLGDDEYQRAKDEAKRLNEGARRSAYELGQSDFSYAVACLTSSTSDGSRKSMVRMAAAALGIEGDPDDKTVDALSDAYWDGVRNADTRLAVLAKTPTVVLEWRVEDWVQNG